MKRLTIALACLIFLLTSCSRKPATEATGLSPEFMASLKPAFEATSEVTNHASLSQEKLSADLDSTKSLSSSAKANIHTQADRDAFLMLAYYHSLQREKGQMLVMRVGTGEDYRQISTKAGECYNDLFDLLHGSDPTTVFTKSPCFQTAQTAKAMLDESGVTSPITTDR